MRNKVVVSTAFFGLAVASLALVACSSSKQSGFDSSSGSSGSSDPTGSSGSSGSFTPGSSGGGGTSSGDGGTVDLTTPPCDGTLTGTDPADYAKAMGLCADPTKDGYGLVSAVFTRGYMRTDAPHDEQHGILTKFGDVIKPQEGAQLAVLSTGYAQEYDGTASAPFGGDTASAINGKDWWGAKPTKGDGAAPPGFPKPAAGCPINANVNDVVDLKLTIKAPATATGFKFDFNFYSGEWPAYVCSSFNDGFVAYLSAAGFNGGTPDNMSFDKLNNPVSVNNGFFDRCSPGVDTGCEASLFAPTTKSVCPGGAAELAGTGFGISGQWCSNAGGSDTSVNGGATGWLTSQAPINGGETFTLELMIWDTGDGLLDSSVLLDHFTWVGGAPVVTGTGRPK